MNATLLLHLLFDQFPCRLCRRVHPLGPDSAWIFHTELLKGIFSFGCDNCIHLQA